MKIKKATDSKSAKRPNISLRRKVRIYIDRATLAAKVLSCIFLYCVFFTSHLDSLKSWLANHFYEYTADNGLVLEKVMVEGQKNILTDDIVATLNADVGTPILSIHLDEVRKALGKNDWVHSVVLERRLPRSIYIGISEREPIAILQQDQKLSLVDNEGHIIPARDIEKFAGLLQVVGSDAHLHADALLTDLMTDPELQKRVTSAVRYGERRWNLILEDGITVKMPENNFTTAYRYLSELNKHDRLFGKNYKTIDLRDGTKYYFEKYPDPNTPQKAK